MARAHAEVGYFPFQHTSCKCGKNLQSFRVGTRSPKRVAVFLAMKSKPVHWLQNTRNVPSCRSSDSCLWHWNPIGMCTELSSFIWFYEICPLWLRYRTVGWCAGGFSVPCDLVDKILLSSSWLGNMPRCQVPRFHLIYTAKERVQQGEYRKGYIFLLKGKSSNILPLQVYSKIWRCWVKEKVFTSFDLLTRRDWLHCPL